MDTDNRIVSFTIPNSEILNCLKEYHYFLKTLFLRKLKSFTTIGSYSNLVCVNSLKQIELTDEICRLVNSIVIKLPCFSIYSGLVISHMLINLWSEPLCENGVGMISREVGELHRILGIGLDSIKIEVKTVNANLLEMIAAQVLLEEPALSLSKTEVRDLSLQTVKAVLSTISGCMGKGLVNIHLEEGVNKFVVYDGILCEISDVSLSSVKMSQSSKNNSYKILLFSECLESSELLPVILEGILNNGISLVVCQKRISDMIKMSLRRNHVVVIERVGEQVMTALEAMTETIPIKHTHDVTRSAFVDFVGEIDSIVIILSNKKNLVSINKTSSYVVTLYVQCRSFADSNLIRLVLNNCIRLIRPAITSPYYLPGPISFEKSLIHFLETKLNDNALFNSIINVFISALKEITVCYGDVKSCESDVLHIYCFKRNAILLSIDTVMNLLCFGRSIRKA